MLNDGQWWGVVRKRRAGREGARFKFAVFHVVTVTQDYVIPRPSLIPKLRNLPFEHNLAGL